MTPAVRLNRVQRSRLTVSKALIAMLTAANWQTRRALVGGMSAEMCGECGGTVQWDG